MSAQLTAEQLGAIWEKEVRLTRAVTPHVLSFGKYNADGYWFDTATCETCGFFFALSRDGEIETQESSRHCQPSRRPAAAA